MNARQALRQDRELKAFNIGVQVRDGVATLWGPLPSDDAVRRALRVVAQVEGIGRVRSDLSVENKLPPLDLRDNPNPLRASSASPERDTGSLNVYTELRAEASGRPEAGEKLVRELPPPSLPFPVTLSIPAPASPPTPRLGPSVLLAPPAPPSVPRPERRQAEVWRAPDNGAQPRNRPVVPGRAMADLASRPPADLPVLPPVVKPPRRDPPSQQSVQPPPSSVVLHEVRAAPSDRRPTAEPLTEALERLRKGNPNFRPVQYQVSGRTVTVRPGDAAGEYATAFAEEARKLRGVGMVLLEE
jgi:hypothetical protein